MVMPCLNGLESSGRYGFFDAAAGFATGGLVIVNAKMLIF